MSDKTRRSFLGQASVAAPALIVLGATAGVAQARNAPKRKRIVSGSPSPAFSRAVVFDRLVYPAGVVGRNPKTDRLASADFEPQCRQALENLKASLEAAGTTMQNVLKCTCFLTDVTDFATFNKIFMSFFPSDPPARSTVIVKELVVKGAKLEIDCVACLPG